MSGVTRRSFLHASAGAAAALSAGTLRAQAPSENVHVALIGAGGQGVFDMGNLLQVPGVRLTAICEINPERVAAAKALAPAARVYDDWNALYAGEKDLQAVLVALPEDTHAAASIAAMEAGLGVFFEKPMGFFLEQSRAGDPGRDAHQRVLQIGQQRRSNPLYYLAERLVQQEGAIGEVLRIDAFWDRWEDWKRPLPALDQDFSRWGYPSLDHLINWRLYRRYGHGLITENGTHQMDAASWLLGGCKASRVCGMGAIRYDDHRETHDICSAEYLFEGDVIVRFNQDFHQGFNYGWSYGELLLGSEGTLRLTAEQELVLYDRRRKATRVPIASLGEIDIAGVPLTVDEMSEFEANAPGGGLRTLSYLNEMRIFIHAIRNRTAPSCTGEIGHNAIAFTVLGSEAQYDGRTIELDEGLFV